jgi:hypothetical protein
MVDGGLNLKKSRGSFAIDHAWKGILKPEPSDLIRAIGSASNDSRNLSYPGQPSTWRRPASQQSLTGERRIRPSNHYSPTRDVLFKDRNKAECWGCSPSAVDRRSTAHGVGGLKRRRKSCRSLASNWPNPRCPRYEDTSAQASAAAVKPNSRQSEHQGANRVDEARISPGRPAARRCCQPTASRPECSVAPPVD